MDSAAIRVFGQITSSPVTSLTISALVVTWVRLFHSRADPLVYSYCYSDLVTKQQWWKLFTAPFCQPSFLSLLFNAVTLWSMRSIEGAYGSWFVFRYSLLLIALQGLLTTWLIHLIIIYVPTPVAFRNIATCGFSGIIISWLAYQKFSSQLVSEQFYLFGLIPLPWDLAPLFIILITPSFLNSKTITLLNVVSLLCGYLLSFGLFEILPDLYWSLCLVLNIATFLLVKSAFFHTFLASLNGAPETEEVEEVVEDQAQRGRGSGDVNDSNSDLETGREDRREEREGLSSRSISPLRPPSRSGLSARPADSGDLEEDRGLGRFSSRDYGGREELGRDSEEEAGAFEGEPSWALMGRGDRS